MAKISALSTLPPPRETEFAPLLLPGLTRLWPNGLPRGTIGEIHGSRSSGRTAACLHILAQATARGEICAVVDWNDAFDPVSAAAAEVELERLLWVRCRGNLEHAMRAVDLLLHAGGFGIVTVDVCEASWRLVHRIPLSSWYRFRRAVEHTSTILLLCTEFQRITSCSTFNINLTNKVLHWIGPGPAFVMGLLEVSPAVPETERKAEILRLAIRLFRPAAPAEVKLAGASPCAVRAASIKGSVLRAAGPWKTSGEWWDTALCWDREEWDVALDDGALYRIYLDLRTQEWFVYGVYD